jgi:hypothetical protein
MGDTWLFNLTAAFSDAVDHSDSHWTAVTPKQSPVARANTAHTMAPASATASGHAEVTLHFCYEKFSEIAIQFAVYIAVISTLSCVWFSWCCTACVTTGDTFKLQLLLIVKLCYLLFVYCKRWQLWVFGGAIQRSNRFVDSNELWIFDTVALTWTLEVSQTDIFLIHTM